MSDCTGGTCYWRSGCGPQSPTAFPGDTLSDRRERWSYQQGILDDSSMSVNRFPTCDWTSGTPTCELNGLLPAPGQLRTGASRTYTARYVLLSNLPHMATFAGRKTGGIRLSVVRKKDGDGGANIRGAVDVNVVIVGSKNIEDSRTDKGKQNLNELFKHVHSHYASNTPASPMNVRLGKVSVYEWDCANGGDAYANVPTSDLRKFFATGSALLPSDGEGKALNVFLTTTIGGSTSTILGVSGGIPGPPLNGTGMSGLVFASMGKLATYNGLCDGVAPCPVALQSGSFVDMGATISHEMGHFLGLYHLSEGNRIAPAPATEPLHDSLPDTPACRRTVATTSGSHYLLASSSSCLASDGSHPMQGLPTAAPYNSVARCNEACPGYSTSSLTGFCPQAVECEFNHVMWWTAKSFVSNGSTYATDGNLFSPASADGVNLSSFVR
jgi:hypothetical protein